MSKIIRKPLTLELGSSEQRTHLSFMPNGSNWLVVPDENNVTSLSRSKMQGYTEDESLDNLTPEQLFDIKQKNNDKLRQLVDIKDRLTVHAYVLKLSLAHGLQTYHQQVSAVLRENVKLSQVGPELISIDRARLSSNLDLSLTKIT